MSKTRLQHSQNNSTDSSRSNPFTEKQLKVLQQPPQRWMMLSGATRSGKTHVSFFLIIREIANHKSENILFVGKTLATLQRNVIEPMQAMFGGYVGNIKADATGGRKVTIFGKECYCVGANDESSENKIRGMSVGVAYCDEIVTYPQSFFEMLKTRLDKANSICIATCNPESPSHYIKQFIDTPDLDIYSEHFTIYDNTFLPKEFVANLEAEFRGTIYFDKWILGKWVKTEGLVFPLFKRERHFLTVEEYAAKYDRQGVLYPYLVIWGVDGANTNDATSIQPIAIMSNGQAVRLEPFYHNPKINGQLSNEQLMPYIRQYMADMERKHDFSRYGTRFYTTVDCAAADLVLTLSYNLPQYYNVNKYTAKNIMQTTDVVNNAFSRDAVHIINYGGYYNYIKGEFVKGDDQLVIDLENMVWDKNNEKYDSKVPNDCADAFRYALCTYFNNIDNLYELAGQRGAYL